jgi:uncharacterized membrane protein YphA (DoxX/SURF4 family)
LFTTFHGGRAGYGLLILRVVLASVTLADGVRRLELISHSTAADPALVGAIAAALAWFVATAFVAVGFLSMATLPPVAIVHAAGVAVMLSEGRLQDGPTMSGAISQTLAAGVALALALTGPGAYSVDARRFGRREIILPAPQAASTAD